jgi:outer membrane protein assembly factor BamB
MPRRILATLLTITGVCCLAAPVSGENWPQWRGERLDGISGEKGLPAEFGPNKNVAWRTPLPGRGGATPVVWGDRIFVSSVDGKDLVLLALDTANGKELWQRVVGTGNRLVSRDEGDYASPSPCTDGKHVWALMSTGDLACFDVAGKEIWQKDLEADYGRIEVGYAFSSSPVLDEGRLYIQLIHSGGARVVALDGATGKEIWKVKRQSDARAECEHSYASPIMYRDDQQKFLVTHGADYAIAHDLKDGRELWRAGGLNVGRYNPTLRFVATPVAVPGLIVVPSAKNGPVLALKPTAMGNITGQEEHHYWTRPNGTPDVPSPLVVEGIVYLCRETGTLTALDAKTGEQIYEEQALHRQRHRASPVYADGKIYTVARDGVVSVIKPGREFQLVAQNKMNEQISASPAVANGTLYLRTFDAIYAIRGNEQAAKKEMAGVGDLRSLESAFRDRGCRTPIGRVECLLKQVLRISTWLCPSCAQPAQ